MSERNHGFTISDHAWRQAIKMGVGRTSIVEVLKDPEIDYDARFGRRIAQRGPLAVVYHPRKRIVVTVLWNRQEAWSR